MAANRPALLAWPCFFHYKAARSVPEPKSMLRPPILRSVARSIARDNAGCKTESYISENRRYFVGKPGIEVPVSILSVRDEPLQNHGCNITKIGTLFGRRD